ncbi:MAG: hypothetical protein JXR19_03670 [Bacteroidia bacterium]
MRTIIRYILCFYLIVLGGNLYAQDIISFYDGENLHLRWKSGQAQGLEGYKVYTDNGSGWQLQKETMRLVKNSKIDKLIGGSTELFLQLAGIEDAEGDFTQAEYDELAANNEAYQFFGAFTGLNINMAQAMGEYVVIETGTSNSLKVKVDMVINGSDKAYLEENIGSIATQMVEVPSVFKAESGDQSVSLSWKKAANEMDAVGYYVYRSNALLGPYIKLNPIGNISFSIEESESEYTDNYLHNGVTYFYYIKFFNAFGMESEMSEILEVIPTPQHKLYISDLEATDRVGDVELKWSISDSSLHYEVYRGDSYHGTYTRIYPPSSLLKMKRARYIDREAEEGVLYYYYVAGSNKQHSKANSDTILFSLADETAPKAPINVQGTVSKGGLVQMTWDENAEIDLLGYEVERFTGDSGVNNFLLTPKPLTQNAFTESLGAKSQSAYRYVVFAIDQSYNRSEGSEPIRLRRPDDIAPFSPIVNQVHFEEGVVHLAWTVSQAKDFDHYAIYRKKEGESWSKLKTSTRAEMNDSITSEGTFYYAISAVDQDGNVSEKSSEVKFSYRPPNSLAAPSQGMATDSANDIYLEWKASTDKRVIGYEIYRYDESQADFKQISELRGKYESFLDRYASNGKQQKYRIVAFDSSYFPSEALEISYTPAN